MCGTVCGQTECIGWATEEVNSTVRRPVCSVIYLKKRGISANSEHLGTCCQSVRIVTQT